MVENYGDKWLAIPANEDDLERLERPYAFQGLPGCIGSMDGVHVAWDNCPAPRRGDAAGKEGYPTVVFNVVTSHTRRIISVAGPFDGARNDKTIVRVDDIVSKVRTLELFTNYVFKMLDASGLEVFCKGAWIMCDGGYHQWRATISPFSPPKNEAEKAWTQLLTDKRKDVERTFGSLKKRFRALRVPFLCREKEDIGHQFRVACILHNILLEREGFEEMGQRESDYLKSELGELSMHKIKTTISKHDEEVDIDYFRIGEAFKATMFDPDKDRAAFANFRNALVVHQLALLALRGGARRLKTFATCIEDRQDDGYNSTEAAIDLMADL